MRQTLNELNKNGFSISLVSEIIERRDYLKKFNTGEYFCIYLTTETIMIIIDGKQYFIPSGNAVFIGPQREVEFTAAIGKEIYSIVFTKEFFDQSFRNSIYLNSHVFFHRDSEIFMAPYFGSGNYNKVLLIERLRKFATFGDESLFRSAAHNSIESIILDAHLHTNHQYLPHEERIASVSIVNRFTVILQRDFKIHKSVSYYADVLRISSRKLTEMTEYVYGKSAKQIIIEKTAAECEKAIKFSKMTLSEIAFDLGFKDEGNFTNFVKKHLGKKPSEMRSAAG